MSEDYFDCRMCGYAPKFLDNRAKAEGVCDTCWTEYFMNDWYRRLQNQKQKK